MIDRLASDRKNNLPGSGLGYKSLFYVRPVLC